MIDITTNPWVVGIGGGILSGFVVTLVTRYIFSKKDNKEYLQKTNSVNREVVYALRPGISEGHIPSKEVLESLINATARRYKVSRNDVYKSKQIAEELIKEIMDSSFISSETKKEYCDTLSHLVQTQLPETESANISIELKAAESEYRSQLVGRMSAILGLTAAIGTSTLSIKHLFNGSNLLSPFSKIFEVLMPSIAILSATMIATLAMLSLKKLQRSDKTNSKSNADEKRKG